MELDLICKKAIKVVKEVAAFMLEERARFNQDTVQIKGKNDLVSYVDITAEKMLVEGLSKILPDAGFLTEEATTTAMTAAAFKTHILNNDISTGNTNYTCNTNITSHTYNTGIHRTTATPTTPTTPTTPARPATHTTPRRQPCGRRHHR